ncbi:RNA-directed DNA polymerase, eukaryota, reverse transcriptase zinc-binding domain protein [Tanacetum coccineum]
MSYVHNRPWCLLGDFNASLHIDDKSVGSSYVDTAMRDFQDCVEAIEVADVNCSGLRFTWNQKPRGEDGVLKKIDRIMANLEFNELFMPSWFTNVLDHNPRFKEIVSIGWQSPVSGFWMYQVVQRLKLLKKPLRKLLFDQRALDANPHNVEIREEEAAYL